MVNNRFMNASYRIVIQVGWLVFDSPETKAGTEARSTPVDWSIRYCRTSLSSVSNMKSALLPGLTTAFIWVEEQLSQGKGLAVEVPPFAVGK
jgi:hypothetical protein